MQKIPGAKKTSLLITEELMQYAKDQAKIRKLPGGFGAYVRFLLKRDMKSRTR